MVGSTCRRDADPLTSADHNTECVRGEKVSRECCANHARLWLNGGGRETESSSAHGSKCSSTVASHHRAWSLLARPMPQLGRPHCGIGPAGEQGSEYLCRGPHPRDAIMAK